MIEVLADHVYPIVPVACLLVGVRRVAGLHHDALLTLALGRGTWRSPVQQDAGGEPGAAGEQEEGEAPKGAPRKGRHCVKFGP